MEGTVALAGRGKGKEKKRDVLLNEKYAM